jgi:hypothetical protein
MTATLQPESKPTSRRALLAGALGGIGAWAASAAARVSPVRAADGNPVLLGNFNTETAECRIQNQTNAQTVLRCENTGGGGIGVQGISDSATGAFGFSGAGITPLPAARAKTGVYGYAGQDSTANGVFGESPAGRAIVGYSPSGYAGYFSGRVYTNKWFELSEVSTPASPSANRARLFVRDSAGKTQLAVKFPNGTVRVLATEA